MASDWWEVSRGDGKLLASGELGGADPQNKPVSPHTPARGKGSNRGHNAESSDTAKATGQWCPQHRPVNGDVRCPKEGGGAGKRPIGGMFTQRGTPTRTFPAI